MKKKLYLFSIFILFLINISGVNAKVIDYQFMGKKVNEIFTINSSSTLSGSSFINVTEDSTKNYVVVDLCSTVGNNISVSVPTDLDGSYTMFYQSYDLKESCNANQYSGTKIRLFFNATTYADSGNGNNAINNITNITNNASYTGVFRLISMGLTNTIDLSDLTINNQDIIINNITNIEDSINNVQDNITNSEENIKNSLNELDQNIDNNFKDTFENCESGKNLIDPSKFTYGYELDLDGSIIPNNNYLVTSYVSIDPNTVYTISGVIGASGSPNYFKTFYDKNKNFISYNTSATFTSPSNAYYVRFNSSTNYPIKLQLEKGSSATSFVPFGETCTNKIDDLNDTQKETNDKLDNLNDNITDSNSSEATGEASDFFSNFNTDTFGLTSVITAPLELIKSITSKSCTPLQLTLPFVNKELDLPCLSTIYENHFGSFLTIYRTITFGFVSYWVCIKIFNLVKDFKNPEHDEIEVLDL